MPREALTKAQAKPQEMRAIRADLGRRGVARIATWRSDSVDERPRV
jgi:hypothetical protein